jgi:protein-disulfide isomerase
VALRALRRLLAAGPLAAAAILCAVLCAAPAASAAPASPHARVVAAVERLLNGIPESGDALGYRSAPVTMQVFGDLECPICRIFALGAAPGLIRHEVRTHRLRIEYRSLQTATRETRVFVAQQVAALAAGRQGKLWYFNEIFYREQGQEDSGYVTPSFLEGMARQVPGLDIQAWEAAREDPLLVEQLNKDAIAASHRNLIGTPSFLIGRTGGRLKALETARLQEPAPFEAAVAKILHSGR